MNLLLKLKSIRLVDWWIIAGLCVVAIAFIAPHQLAVTAYKLSLVSLAAVVGYRIDRSAFPYARPDAEAVTPGIERAAAWIRRAIIIAAAMVAVSLGA